MSSPRVTVILSTYQGEAYLEEALASVLGQTFRDFEFLVVEDGSTDRSLEILRAAAARDARLRVIPLDKNRGVGYAYARLLREARGEFVAQLGQDDAWMPSLLTALVARLEKDAEAVAVFCDVQIIDDNGAPRTDSPFRHDWLEQFDHETLALHVLRYNFLCGGSSLFRTSAIRDWTTLGYNDQLQDWNTWQHLILRGKFRRLPEVHHRYRVHGANLSLGSGKNPRQIQLELHHTRTQMLLDPALAAWIDEARDPNARLRHVLEAAAERMNPGEESHWFALFYFLRSNELRWESFPIFRAWIGLCFWREGSLRKAMRYAPEEVANLLPAAWLGSLRPSAFLLWTRWGISSGVWRGLVVCRLGPLVWAKVWLKPAFADRVHLRLDSNVGSVEAAVEAELAETQFAMALRVLKTHRFGIFKKLWNRRKKPAA